LAFSATLPSKEHSESESNQEDDAGGDDATDFCSRQVMLGATGRVWRQGREGGNDERVAVAVPPTLEDMPDEADAEADVLGCCKQLLSDEEESRSEKKTDRVIGCTCSVGERNNKTLAFRTAAS
jgi:hypothetical protein